MFFKYSYQYEAENQGDTGGTTTSISSIFPLFWFSATFAVQVMKEWFLSAWIFLHGLWDTLYR